MVCSHRLLTSTHTIVTWLLTPRPGAVGRSINNCICPETGKLPPGVADAGNAKALPMLGFDGVKIDGCGPDRNVTRFAQLVDAVSGGRHIMIEDCNDDP